MIRGIKNRRTSIIAFFMVLVLAFVLPGCSLFPKEEEVDGPLLISQEGIKYNTVEAVKESISMSMSGRGTFESTVQQNVFFNSGKGGNLKSFNFTPGDNVKKGQLLAEIDQGSLLNDIKEQELILEKTKINMDRLKAQGAGEYDIKAANIDIKLAELRLNDLKEQLKNTKLYAPISGLIVYFSATKLGDYIEAFKPLYIIADPGQIQIRVTSVFGGAIEDLSVGANVRVTYKRNAYNGKIVTIPTTAQKYNPTTIKLESKPKDVALGDTVDFTVEVVRKDNAIVVPRNAVHEYEKNSSVFVLENNQKVQKFVKAGISNNDKTEIIEGIKEGEKIIID